MCPSAQDRAGMGRPRRLCRAQGCSGRVDLPWSCWRPRQSAHPAQPSCNITKTVIAKGHRSCEHVKVSTVASAMVGWASPSVFPTREVIVRLRIQGYPASMNEVFPDGQNEVTWGSARGTRPDLRASRGRRFATESSALGGVRTPPRGRARPGWLRVRGITGSRRQRVPDTQPLNFRV